MLTTDQRQDGAACEARCHSQDPSAEDFCACLRAQWEACGPWVPDEDLTDDGRAVKAAFADLLADARLRATP